MTGDRVADMRKRLEAATPGPWSSMTEETSDGENIYYTVEARAEAGSGEFYMLADMADTGLQGSADAEFIAHARQDVPLLLAEVARLRAQLDGVRELADKLHREHGRYGASTIGYDPAVAKTVHDIYAAIATDGKQ